MVNGMRGGVRIDNGRTRSGGKPLFGPPLIINEKHGRGGAGGGAKRP